MKWALILLGSLGGFFLTVDDGLAQTRERLCAESDWEPEATAALVAARRRLYAGLRCRIITDHPSLDESVLTAERLAGWLSSSKIDVRQNNERRERAYGTLWRVGLEAELAAETIARWADDAAVQTLREQRRRWGKLAGVCGSLLVVCFSVRTVDRWTQGYRRLHALSIGAAVAVVLGICLWLI